MFFPWPGYCKWCCNEHWGICVFLKLQFSQSIFPEVGLLSHRVVLFLVF